MYFRYILFRHFIFVLLFICVKDFFIQQNFFLLNI